MELKFPQPVPLFDPFPLSLPSEKLANILTQFKTDENSSNLTNMIIDQQLGAGKHFLENILEDINKDVVPVFLQPSFEFAKNKVYADRMDLAYCGTVGISGRTVYHVGGKQLISICKVDLTETSSPEVVIDDACTEGPVEQLVLTEKLLVIKAAFEIAAYKLDCFERILHFQHEQPIKRIAVSPEVFGIAFADEENIYLLSEKGMKKLIWRQNVIDLLFTNSNRIRYSCDFRVFEVMPNEQECKVFDTSNLHKTVEIFLMRTSERCQQLLYYLTKNEVYAVTENARGDYLDKYRHSLNFAPTYACVASSDFGELIFFAAAIGRVQVIVCEVSSESCQFRSLLSIDTVAQTLRSLALNNCIFLSYSSKHRLTAPLLGVAAVSDGETLKVYMQNVYGDLFCVNREEVEMSKVYEHWLVKYEEQQKIVITGLLPLPEEKYLNLFDFDEDEEFWEE